MTDLLQQLELGDGIEQPVDQWTLIGVKLVNWGTFSGYNAVPIHADGHMVTGESGSGKSTLLDAISSVIYHPKDLNFNAAAESGSKRDRSDYTYVRGASSRGKNDDGITTLRFARNGVTWSGIALTLHNPAQRKVTLVKAFRASASCADSSSLAKVSMVFDGEFDPRALAPFMDTKIDLVGIKNKLNPELASTDFKPFQERYLRIFGMKKEVLHLLQKVQSMQGVSSLDKLMQDFVLDDPTTFAHRDSAVAWFRHLKPVRERVLKARNQRDHLSRIREQRTTIDEARETIANRDEQTAATKRVRAELAVSILTSSKAIAEQKSADAEKAVRLADDAIRQLERERGTLEQEKFNAGGGDQIRLEQEQRDANQLVKTREERRSKLTELTRQTGLDAVTDRTSFDAVTAQALEEILGIEQESAAAVDGGRSAQDAVTAARKKLDPIIKERDSLARRAKSNVGDRDDNVRRQIAAATGVPVEHLPFSAELMQVKSDHDAWSGAIERALRGFARNILVPERHYRDVTEYVKSVQLGWDVDYLVVPVAAGGRPIDPDKRSVISKLDFAPGEFRDWLINRMHKTNDFLCVDSFDGLPKDELAMTITGLIRRPGGRHSKHDRTPIDRRRDWILGFDNTQKLAGLNRDVAELNEILRKVTDVRDDLEKAEVNRKVRNGRLNQIIAVLWEDVDVAGAAEGAEQVTRMLRLKLEQNPNLRAIEVQLETVRGQLAKEKEKQKLAVGQAAIARDNFDNDTRSLAEEVEVLATSVPVPAEIAEQVTFRLNVTSRTTIRGLDERITAAREAISLERQSARELASETEAAMGKTFEMFIDEWPEDRENMDASLSSYSEFLAYLELIERDRLPDFQNQFETLMNDGATRNLTDLYRALEEERRAIRRRILPINEALATTEFSRGTRLRIDVEDVVKDVLTRFRRDLTELMQLSATAEPNTVEDRYARLDAIIGRLGTEDPKEQAWQRQVLDVRTHVQFTAVELDSDYTEVDRYDNGDGRSGGERAKLLTFMLATALRYQLTGDGAAIPVFGLVMFDEAFSSEDPGFTEQSLNAFQGFGFQVMLVTPHRALKLFSRFVKGITVVSKSAKTTEASKSSMKHVLVEDAGNLD